MMFCIVVRVKIRYNMPTSFQYFTSISLDDVVRRCHLTSKELALRYLSEMTAQGKLRAQINQENNVVYFEELRVII